MWKFSFRKHLRGVFLALVTVKKNNSHEFVTVTQLIQRVIFYFHLPFPAPFKVSVIARHKKTLFRSFRQIVGAP